MEETEKKSLSKEVYEHFGLDLQQMLEQRQEHDWGILKREDAEKCTRNMMGFGMGQSQRIIIDYDKDYGWVLVRRIRRGCGAVENTPQKN